MTDQITYKQLIEALDTKFEEHDKYHVKIDKLLDRHEESIHGNGSPGLKGRVQKLETTNSHMKKFLGGIATLFGVFLAWLGAKS